MSRRRELHFRHQDLLFGGVLFVAFVSIWMVILQRTSELGVRLEEGAVQATANQAKAVFELTALRELGEFEATGRSIATDRSVVDLTEAQNKKRLDQVIRRLAGREKNQDKLTILDFEGDHLQGPDDPGAEIADYATLVAAALNGASSFAVQSLNGSVQLVGVTPVGTTAAPAGVLVLRRAFDFTLVDEAIIPLGVGLTVWVGNRSLHSLAAAPSKDQRAAIDGMEASLAGIKVALALDVPRSRGFIERSFLVNSGLLIGVVFCLSWAALAILWRRARWPLRQLVAEIAAMESKVGTGVSLNVAGDLPQTGELRAKLNGFFALFQNKIKETEEKATKATRLLEKIESLRGVVDESFMLFLKSTDREREICIDTMHRVGVNEASKILEPLLRFSTTVGNEAKLFGLHHVHVVAQALQDAIAGYRERPDTMQSDEVKNLLGSFATLCSEIDAYCETRRRYLGRDVRQGVVTTVSRQEVDYIQCLTNQALAAASGAMVSKAEVDDLRKKFERTFSLLGKVDIRRYLVRYDEMVSIWSKERQLVVAPLEFYGEELYVEPDEMYVIHSLLVQLLRNAIQHAFSNKVGTKAVPGVIKVEMARVADGIELVVRDNGAGIDIDRLRTFAQSQGIDVSTASNLELVLGEFGEGQRAGYGRGLSAAWATVSEVGGQIEILSAAGAGMTVKCVLPSDDLIRYQHQVFSVPHVCRRIFESMQRSGASGSLFVVESDAQVMALNDYGFLSSCLYRLANLFVGSWSGSEPLSVKVRQEEAHGLALARIDVNLGASEARTTLANLMRNPEFKRLLSDVQGAHGFHFQIVPTTGVCSLLVQTNLASDFSVPEVRVEIFDSDRGEEVKRLVKAWQDRLVGDLPIHMILQELDFMPAEGDKMTRIGVVSDIAEIKTEEVGVTWLVLGADFGQLSGKAFGTDNVVLEEDPPSMWSLSTVFSLAIERNLRAERQSFMLKVGS